MRHRRHDQGWLIAVAMLVAGCGSVSAGGATPGTGEASSTVTPSTVTSPAIGPSSASSSLVTSPSANVAALPTCGSIPASTGASSASVGITVSAPASAVAGSTLTVRMQVHSLDGKHHQLTTGNAFLLLAREGQVVGKYDGAVAGNGILINVTAAGSRRLDVSGLVSGCPVEPVDMSAPDLTREALPPGRYDVVVAAPDVTAKPFGELVSPPVPIQVVADPHALPACGTVPASTEPPQSRIAGTLTGPATAKAGTTARLQVMLRSNRGRPETLSSSLPITVLIVRNGVVVGRTDGPVAGVGVEVTVPASGEIPLLHPNEDPAYFGDVTFSGCPAVASPNATVTSPSPRTPLPPGPYQVVAVVRDGTGVLVTQPFDVHLT